MVMGAIKFIRDNRQASSVQNLFRESNNSYREFLNIAERRAKLTYYRITASGLLLNREISCEIDDIKSKWDPLAISAEMISALERDSEYRKARIALSEGAQERQAKLGSEIGTA
jgi:hypothetical protein